VLNCDVGVDITFEDIRAKHDFVVIATGVYKSRDLPAPGVGAQGIVRRSTT
jgi:glutamate synthase (NADPH/NADH) small chain